MATGVDVAHADRTAAPSAETATTGITANQVATQYAAVGRALLELQNQHGAATTVDLWPRYRIIKLSDAMSTPQHRTEAMAVLSALSSEIKTRKP